MDIQKFLNSLEEIKAFQGPLENFWSAYLRLARKAALADRVALWIKDPQGGWQQPCVWPTAPSKEEFPSLADDTLASGYAAQTGNPTPGVRASGIRLELNEGAAILLFSYSGGCELDPDHILPVVLKLLADIPAAWQSRRLAEQARNDVVYFSRSLDIMTLLNSEKKYMAIAMAFCNEIASRFKCQRVSLGWLQKGYVRVQAISHMDKFEKKMEAVQSLEAAMEEAFDQDEEIVFPRQGNSGSVVRDHEYYARQHGGHHLASLPIRLDDEVTGVLCCERDGGTFFEHEINGLRIICDQAARRIDDLHKSDKWFGARLAAWFKRKAATLLGVEYTLSKLTAILMVIAVAVLVFCKWDYRVEAPFILDTDDLSYLPAPYDGYIDTVNVRVGDPVGEKTVLINLDTRELLLEESSALADISRYQREMEKARAENALADMKIAATLKQQARARLDLVRYNLGNAHVKAPFKGIVVEGDLKKMLGAPVRKGDILFKLARIENMYAQIRVDEKDIHEIRNDASAQITFLSRPDKTFDIRIERIEPLASSEEEGNIFILRAEFESTGDPWFRPGMSGIAKINVEKRTLLWIFSHRTVNFLRLFFWW